MNTSDDKLAKLNEQLKLAAFACATLGLAPFVPQPHIWEKIKMLFAGSLSKPIDIFDLFFHGAPWIFAIVVLVKLVRHKSGSSTKAE